MNKAFKITFGSMKGVNVAEDGDFECGYAAAPEQPVGVERDNARTFTLRYLEEHGVGQISSMDATAIAEAYAASLRHEIAALRLKSWPQYKAEKVIELEREIATLKALLNYEGQRYESWLDVGQELLRRKAEIAALKKENERLRDWKESAIACTPNWQEIGRAIGVMLGDSVHDKVLPAIWALRSRIAELEKKK
jgi:hypothetical protein